MGTRADVGTSADVILTDECAQRTPHLTHSRRDAAGPRLHDDEAGGDRGAEPAAEPSLRLIFFTSPTSGPCRRMHGLVAWVKVTRKAALSVVEADLERHAPIARKLGVTHAPTLVLMRDGVPVARHVGRATGREIDQLLRPWLGPGSAGTDGEHDIDASPDEAGSAPPEGEGGVRASGADGAPPADARGGQVVSGDASEVEAA